MRKGPLIAGVILLILGLLMAVGGFGASAQASSEYNTSCTGFTRFLLPSQCADLASRASSEGLLGFFGFVLFLVGLGLTIYGVVAKKTEPVTAQPAFQPVAQPIQYQPLTPQGQVVNPPTPSYRSPPVNPPAPQGPQPTPGTGAQFAKSFCIKCGAPVPTGAAFCGACGAKMG